jgi:phosphatidylserine/phosphatidylglycerophosphate/cardiolipin synthase-like enzyme
MMESNLFLSDGTPICPDFTAAAVISEPDRLHRLRIGIGILGSTIESDTEGSSDARSAEILDVPGLPVPVRNRPYSFTRSQLNAVLAAFDEKLSPREFNAVASALCNADVAYEIPTSQGYADYVIKVTAPLSALRIIEQQLIASVSAPEMRSSSSTDTSSAELVATLPADVQSKLPKSVRPIRISIRRYLAEATDTVRIANPYFDDTEHVLNDLAALPRRGVDLKLVTREVDTDDPNRSAVDPIEEITGQLSDDERNHLFVRDFYDTDRYDKQLGATHAKAVIIDDQIAYLGSANLTRLSLTGNFELGVLLRGELVADLVAVFDAMFDYARPIPI